jgi:hypothetical protein
MQTGVDAMPAYDRLLVRARPPWVYAATSFGDPRDRIESDGARALQK